MKSLYPFLLLFLSIDAFSQNAEQDIRTQFLTYNQLIIDKNIDAALDYTNEGLFTVIPREQMKSMMEAVFNMSAVEYRTPLPEILDIAPVRTIDGAHYARIRTKSLIGMKFGQRPDEPKRTEEEEKGYQKMLLTTFQAKYGKENVAFDETTGFFSITVTKTAIARSTDTKNWKFAVVDNPRMSGLLEKFIPKEMLD